MSLHTQHSARQILQLSGEISLLCLSSSFAAGSSGAKILENPVVVDIAKKHNKTPAQIIVRWCVEQGMSVIPKSTHPDRIKQNFNVLDFTLSSEDVTSISNLNANVWCLGYQKPFYGYNPFA